LPDPNILAAAVARRDAQWREWIGSTSLRRRHPLGPVFPDFDE